MKPESYVPGDWNAICDVCGDKFRASELKKRWDGFMVCYRDYETRQPQDFVRGINDVQAPPWTRDGGTDQFLGFCTVQGQSALSGSSVCGCWVSGKPLPLGFYPTINP